MKISAGNRYRCEESIFPGEENIDPCPEIIDPTITPLRLGVRRTRSTGVHLISSKATISSGRRFTSREDR
jgi:hypothetical protein